MLKTMTLTALSMTALFEGHALAKDSYISFVMDRSQSMEQVRVDGSTRCAYSKEFTKQTLNRLYDRYAKEGTVYINLEIFGSPGGQQSITQGFSKDKNSVMAAIDRLGDEDCQQASTALTDAMCHVANAMRSQTADMNTNLLVYGITDGEENSSSFTECGSNLAAGWQTYITSKFKDETPRIIYNAAIFTGEDIRTPEAEARDGRNIPRTTTFEFLINLAKETGGTVTVVNDQDSNPPKQFPVPEVSLNSFQTVKFTKDSQTACVDASTFALVMHAGDNDLKRVDHVDNDFIETSLMANYQDCTVTITCAQSPLQNFTVLAYQRLCASNGFVGNLDDKVLRELDANLSIY